MARSRRYSALLLLAVLLAAALPVAAQPPPRSARSPGAIAHLAFVGDVMIGRAVGRHIAQRGYAYPFEPVTQLTAGADLAFGNLESPLTTASRERGGYDLVGSPGNVASLSCAGFDVVSLANNHATDHGSDGLRETIRRLEEVGIVHVGAGTTITEAYAPRLTATSGITVAYFAYDATHGSVLARDTTPGTAAPDAGRVAGDLSAARGAGCLVVVSVHWGQEYQAMPSPAQRDAARRLARAGADVVIGHHPHVVQPLEWLVDNGRPTPTLVAYSLGNFVFDQDFSQETSESAFLIVEVGPQGLISAALTPLRVGRGQVRTVRSSEAVPMLMRILGAPLPQPTRQAFSFVRLPGGQRDFTVRWLTDSHAPADLAPRSTDADGDRRPDRLVAAGTGRVIECANGKTWRTPAGLQIRDARLDDADGDGIAELIALGQASEELGPVCGSRITVWKWDGARFSIDWSSHFADFRSLSLVDSTDTGRHDIAVRVR